MNAVIKGSHVLAAMLAFFAVVIAINVGFMVAAISSFPGEDAPRSYLQGLHYNETLAERRAQRALGWRAGAEIRSDASGAQLIVVMRSRDGAALNGLTVTADLRRRTSSRFDRTLSFTPRGNGIYVAELVDLRPGQWRVRAHTADAAGDTLDFQSDLTWPSR